jgi:hypothetical protein
MYILLNLVLIFSHTFLFIFSKHKQRKEDHEKEEEYKFNLLCRFVINGIGKTVGESIAVNNDLLIIKTNDKYLGVPLKHIQDNGKTLLVKGLIDNSNAEFMGKKWREENFKEISNDIDDE